MTRVLIVDDNAANRYLLRAMLEGHGYVVDEAQHGGEALVLANQHPPDLTISDLLMPGMDGYMLLRRWKSHDRLKSIPFVVYTATYTDPRDERLAMDLGADAFILKPAEPDAFMVRVNELLARRDQGQLPIHERPADESALLNEYSQILVAKLELKAQQLEQSNKELRAEIAERKQIEAALRGSEERYRTLFHAIAEPLIVYDRETLVYLGVNDAAVRAYGYSRDEFLQMTVLDIRPPEEAPALLEALKRQGIEREHHGVWRHRRKNGEVFEVEITTYGLEYAGRPACLVQARDVTQQRRAEADLARSTELLRVVADGTPDALFIKDRAGKYLLFNAAASRFVGKPPAEVLGQDDTAIFSAEDARLIREHDQRVMETNEMQVAEEPLNTALGLRTFLAIKVPYRDAGGQVIGVIGISRDVTEHKQAERALRLRDRAIQAVSQGIIITNALQGDNVIVYASPGFERLTGYRSDEVLGHNCRFLQGKDTDPETVARLRDAIAARQPCDVEILNYRRDGTAFWNALSLSPVEDERGRLAWFVGIQSDVTERRALENQLRQAQKMEAVGRLAGGVAHDFNNLLTVISGYSELVLATPGLTADITESVHAIRDAGDRAALLTRQLLGFSRQTMLQPRVLDLNCLIVDTEKLLRRLIGEDITLSTVLAADLHPVKVDPGQLNQVLMNLAVNSRDAMPRGGKLTIETANVFVSEDYLAKHLDCRVGHHVLLAVSDTGCGMTPEVAGRVFEPFFTTKEVGRGTGLGLSVVFGIVQQSNGCIHVYSEEGLGTTFKIYLPAVAEALTVVKPPVSSVDVRGTESILLVEDDSQVRNQALLSLQHFGYRVVAAGDGLQALQAAEAHAGPFDLLLTDIVMPNLSGPALAESMKVRQPGLRVLFMSGYTDDAVLRHGLLQGDVDFIQKPYSPVSLARKVREVLDAK